MSNQTKIQNLEAQYDEVDMQCANIYEEIAELKRKRAELMERQEQIMDELKMHSKRVDEIADTLLSFNNDYRDRIEDFVARNILDREMCFTFIVGFVVAKFPSAMDITQDVANTVLDDLIEAGLTELDE